MLKKWARPWEFPRDLGTKDKELFDYGFSFIESLGLPEAMADSSCEVLESTLQRTPESGSSTKGIRQVMDPDER